MKSATLVTKMNKKCNPGCKNERKVQPWLQKLTKSATMVTKINEKCNPGYKNEQKVQPWLQK